VTIAGLTGVSSFLGVSSGPHVEGEGGRGAYPVHPPAGMPSEDSVVSRVMAHMLAGQQIALVLHVRNGGVEQLTSPGCLAATLLCVYTCMCGMYARV